MTARPTYEQLEAVAHEMRSTIDAARFVADYWRQAMLAAPESKWAAHPLCMVLTALDGESDPVACGIDDSEWDAFRAAVSGSGAEDA